MILLIYPIASYCRIEWVNYQKNKDMKVLVYCKAGNRGAAASQLIADAGYKRVYNVQGGINSWVNAGCPIVVDPTEWTASYPSSL
ncbi:rhodanese-like domain-containing protein [Methanosarcina horonobensis]|uniref:rhodanese-like domain-containing protein n=1 Tax=Methanosarcina horonobensis TaxID=418008 RepID=UPI000ADC60F2|nr:rhodanese-like domain-containing protein [Methanosarcina horonobensis]